MTSAKPYLAVDLGASSGRAVLGHIQQGRLALEEIHRFTNKAVQLHGGIYWDFVALWESVLDSLRICAERGHTRLAGIGVDTWAVDSGLIGKDGKLLGNCFCYRDPRTDNIAELVAAKVDDREPSDRFPVSTHRFAEPDDCAEEQRLQDARHR